MRWVTLTAIKSASKYHVLFDTGLTGIVGPQKEAMFLNIYIYLKLQSASQEVRDKCASGNTDAFFLNSLLPTISFGLGEHWYGGKRQGFH
jgi:hypothetical protein